ncbi:IS1182 family transposase [Flavobacteriaceae bacterium F89]|uniref:IS1182 family transposase n=1 Tax=Cerina litoralis TaxID=2874477 RepID=A0AAE3EXH9_9FLAO|nr:IS1182 family transposase [Cerina litoralis]MCG2462950.1 IS1182 family transposase [Cerina litoralis]
MKHIKGKDRRQSSLFPVSLEDAIDNENTVRALDNFVNGLDMEKLGFKVHFPENGRPAYHPATLLKLYIYGYMNKVRSSRQLEKECRRNIEVMWLLECLVPDHNTISNFRKDNPKAIKMVFRATVEIARNFGLIGATLIAGDSTKLRAQNSKKNNYNQKKIDRHIAYIDKKLAEYQGQLEKGDGDRKEVKGEIEKHRKRKQGYRELERKLGESGKEQISTSDPESRHMIVRNNITEVAYNLQSTVDARHCIPIDYKVTGNNDTKAMGNMLRRAKTILRTNGFTALYDKGYHTGSEFKTAHDLGIATLVAVPDIGRASRAPDPAYNAEHFEYDGKEDTYTCPQGHVLKSNGSRYKARNYFFKQYKTKSCRTCPVRGLCTTAKQNGKIIQRSEFKEFVDKNDERMAGNQELYKRRQAIVEHPFGTIKRQWGFDHIMTKRTRARASADVGLIFIAYNLKRILNLIGKKANIPVHRALNAILRAAERISGRPRPICRPKIIAAHFGPLSAKSLIFDYI